MLSNEFQHKNLMAACLQCRPIGLESCQQFLVTRRQDEFGLGNFDAMYQGLGGKVGVDQGRCGADSHQTQPGAHHIGGVDHVKYDTMTWFDALREKPLGVLVDPVVCLGVGQAFRMRPDRLVVAILGGYLVEEVIAADGAVFRCFHKLCKGILTDQKLSDI